MNSNISNLNISYSPPPHYLPGTKEGGQLVDGQHRILSEISNLHHGADAQHRILSEISHLHHGDDAQHWILSEISYLHPGDDAQHWIFMINAHIRDFGDLPYFNEETHTTGDSDKQKTNFRTGIYGRYRTYLTRYRYGTAPNTKQLGTGTVPTQLDTVLKMDSQWISYSSYLTTVLVSLSKT